MIDQTKAEVLLATPKFAVQRLEYKSASGGVVTKEIIRHPGAVAILPVLDDGRICLIRNYRASVNETLIEVPAGTLDPDESPATCARRELAEETGYTAGDIESLGWFYLSPGILDERIHLFVATRLDKGEPNRMADEQIENCLVTLPEALKMIDEQIIHDAKTIVALLRWERIGD